MWNAVPRAAYRPPVLDRGWSVVRFAVVVRTAGVAITTMLRDMQCEVAAAHGAKCVDLGLALHGPDLHHHRT